VKIVIKRAKEFSKKNYKNRKPRTEYMRNYMMKRRKNDPVFKELINKYNRKNNGKSDNKKVAQNKYITQHLNNSMSKQ